MSSHQIFRLLYWLSFILLLLGCSDEPTELKTYLLQSTQTKDIDSLASLIQSKSNIRIVEYKPKDSAVRINPIELLSRNEIDLTVIANSENFRKNVKIVLPLYRGVLHVLVRESLDIENSDEFILNHSIYIENNSSVAWEFLQVFAKLRNFKFDQLNLVKKFVPGETDVIIAFAPILPSTRNIKGYRILSFGSVDNIGKGGKVDAISYLVPQMHPFVIPTNTYRGISGNESPVVTIAVDMLLATNDSVDRNTIRNLAESLMDSRAELSMVMPSVFYSMSDDFDPNKLKFPLHPGARDFIERRSPSFLERYAELINTLVYLTVLVFTSAIAFIRWRQRKRKDRIDIFYEKLFLIRDSLNNQQAIDKNECQSSLRELEREAFQLLIDEKVAADASFIIFETLLHDTITQAKKHFST